MTPSPVSHGGPWNGPRCRKQAKVYVELDARVRAEIVAAESAGRPPPGTRSVAAALGVSRGRVLASFLRLRLARARLEAVLGDLERTGATGSRGDERAVIVACAIDALEDFPDLAEVASRERGILDSLTDLREQDARAGAIVYLVASSLCSSGELARSMRLACGTAAAGVLRGALRILEGEDGTKAPRSPVATSTASTAGKARGRAPGPAGAGAATKGGRS